MYLYLDKELTRQTLCDLLASDWRSQDWDLKIVSFYSKKKYSTLHGFVSKEITVHCMVLLA